MTHPSRRTELVLRGIFTCRRSEVDWFYQGPGAGYLFPEDWEAFQEAMPDSERGDLLTAYSRRVRGDLGEAGALSLSSALRLLCAVVWV